MVDIKTCPLLAMMAMVEKQLIQGIRGI